MKKTKLVLAAAAAAATTLSVAPAALATTASPSSGAPAGGGGYVTLDDACAEYNGLQAPDGFRVNLVTDVGKIDDGTFNQFADQGLKRRQRVLRHRGHQLHRDRDPSRLRGQHRDGARRATRTC